MSSQISPPQITFSVMEKVLQNILYSVLRNDAVELRHIPYNQVIEAAGGNAEVVNILLDYISDDVKDLQGSPTAVEK
jgi:hypothetical protein